MIGVRSPRPMTLAQRYCLLSSYLDFGLIILKFFTCGSGVIATGIRTKLADMVRGDRTDMTDEELAAKFEKVIAGRYATDIFD